MANEMKIFKSEQFGTVRTMVDEEIKAVYFCLVDVCKVLDLVPSKVVQRLEKEVLSKYTLPTAGGPQKTNFINEDGLYDVILDSRKPEAKAFRKWVTGTVLPQIRKTGGYIPLDDNADEKTVLCRALQILQKTLEQKDELLEAQKPKVQFVEALSGSQSSIQLSEMAKLITENGHEIGRTRLFTWMRKHGYIFQHSTEPRQEWVSNGIFEVKATLITTPHGNLRETITPLVTVKGQEYFLNLFKSVA